MLKLESTGVQDHRKRAGRKSGVHLSRKWPPIIRRHGLRPVVFNTGFWFVAMALEEHSYIFFVQKNVSLVVSVAFF